MPSGAITPLEVSQDICREDNKPNQNMKREKLPLDRRRMHHEELEAMAAVWACTRAVHVNIAERWLRPNPTSPPNSGAADGSASET